MTRGSPRSRASWAWTTRSTWGIYRRMIIAYPEPDQLPSDPEPGSWLVESLRDGVRVSGDRTALAGTDPEATLR